MIQVVVFPQALLWDLWEQPPVENITPVEKPPLTGT